MEDNKEKKELEFDNEPFITENDIIDNKIGKDFEVKDGKKSKYIKIDYIITGNVSRYTVDSKIVIKIVYWNKNASNEYEAGATQSITITPTKNSDSVNIRVFSNYIKEIRVDELNCSISSISIYGSHDLADNQLVEVVKADTIYSTVVQSKISWTSSLIVDRIETNLQSIVYKGDINEIGNNGTSNENSNTPVETEKLREFIILKDRTLSFKESNIDLTQFEDLKIEVDGVDTQVYWSAIRDHDDAYKYYTLVTPEEVYPDITPEEAEAYKVKVYKTKSTAEKLKIEFEEEEKDGKTAYVPRIVLGAGTDTTTNKGKGYIYKYTDSLNVEYIDKTGETRGIKVGDSGPIAKNGLATGIHNTFILDHEPTTEDITTYGIQEYDIVIVVAN